MQSWDLTRRNCDCMCTEKRSRPQHQDRANAISGPKVMRLSVHVHRPEELTQA